MNSHMAQAPFGYLISLAMEPLPPLDTYANILGRNTACHHPMQIMATLAISIWDCDHPSEWVKMKTMHIAKFVGKQCKTRKKP